MDEGEGIPRRGHTEMGAGNREGLLFQGEGKRPDSRAAPGGPGEGGTLDHPAPGRVQAVVGQNLGALPVVALRYTGVPAEGAAVGAAEGPSVEQEGGGKMKAQGVFTLQKHLVFPGEGFHIVVPLRQVPPVQEGPDVRGSTSIQTSTTSPQAQA